LIETGGLVQSGWRTAADRAGLSITVSGMPPLAHFSFDVADRQAVRTLFTQIMLEKGFLATNAFYASYAHESRHVESYLAAVDSAFAAIARAIDKNEVRQLLKGPVAHEGFHRLA